MSSDAAANPASGLGWKKYLFMAIGITLFIVVYYSPPWPDAIDPGTIKGDISELKVEDFWYLDPLNRALDKVGRVSE